MPQKLSYHLRGLTLLALKKKGERSPFQSVFQFPNAQEKANEKKNNKKAKNFKKVVDRRV